MQETKGTDPLEHELEQLANQVEQREAAKSETGPKLVTLSDGRQARVRRAKGKDLERGAAVAQNATNPMSLFMGVVAQVTEVDGKRLVYEDVLELDLSDVMTLIGAVGGNVPVPSQG